MSKPSLEERVAELERQLADLKRAFMHGDRPKDWRRTIGMFAGDEVMKQIDEEARRFREKDRERARRRYAKPRQAQK
jgi:hypothetical protein